MVLVFHKEHKTSTRPNVTGTPPDSPPHSLHAEAGRSGAGTLLTQQSVPTSVYPSGEQHPYAVSDPLLLVLQYGRTEVIDNTLNPDFVHKFIMDYFFEERQNLRFDLYDLDCKSEKLSKHDFLGQAFCTLGEVVGSLGSRLEKPLIGIPGRKCGTVIVRAEELTNCRESVMLQFCGNKLDKKDFFGKSDPFLVFYRSNEDGSYTISHKTEVVKNTLDPVWQAFKIPVRALCNGDYDRSIKVEVYDWDRDGGHDFIGEFSTSYREMSRGQTQFHIYEVLNPKKKGKKKKKYQNSGTVTLLSCLVDSELSFLDFIKGGNPFPQYSEGVSGLGVSYLWPVKTPETGTVMKGWDWDYDSDKMFPALGFGDKLPPGRTRLHEFALYASAVTDGSQYFILLIISAESSPTGQTKESIVTPAHLPVRLTCLRTGSAHPSHYAEAINTSLHGALSLLVVAGRSGISESYKVEAQTQAARAAYGTRLHAEAQRLNNIAGL
ncbi:unnamed protein product [Lota lota]